MNEQQFERYTNGLTALAEANQQSAHDTAHCVEVTKTINKLIKQTAWCISLDRNFCKGKFLGMTIVYNNCFTYMTRL